MFELGVVPPGQCLTIGVRADWESPSQQELLLDLYGFSFVSVDAYKPDCPATPLPKKRRVQSRYRSVKDCFLGVPHICMLFEGVKMKRVSLPAAPQGAPSDRETLSSSAGED